MEPLAIEQIIKNIANGETQEFEKVVSRYQKPIFLPGYSVLQNIRL